MLVVDGHADRAAVPVAGDLHGPGRSPGDESADPGPAGHQRPRRGRNTCVLSAENPLFRFVGVICCTTNCRGLVVDLSTARHVADLSVRLLIVVNLSRRIHSCHMQTL